MPGQLPQRAGQPPVDAGPAPRGTLAGALGGEVRAGQALLLPLLLGEDDVGVCGETHGSAPSCSCWSVVRMAPRFAPEVPPDMGKSPIPASPSVPLRPPGP